MTARAGSIIYLFRSVLPLVGRFRLPDVLPRIFARYFFPFAVAIGGSLYGDSGFCGACIEGSGSGVGAGGNPIEGSFKVGRKEDFGLALFPKLHDPCYG